ncbi:hypothetical protein ACLB2K_033855 [Fragaria x ananassa]
MALVNVAALRFTFSALFRSRSAASDFQVLQIRRSFFMKPVVMRARQPARTENAKTLNRSLLCRFHPNACYNGTPTKPRLSVFCSDKQLYAMLVDDQNKKCLFYGSTLQKSIRQDPHCSTVEAAKRVGEELIRPAMI